MYDTAVRNNTSAWDTRTHAAYTLSDGSPCGSLIDSTNRSV